MTYNNQDFLEREIQMIASHYFYNQAECEMTDTEIDVEAEKIAKKAVAEIKAVENTYQREN